MKYILSLILFLCSIAIALGQTTAQLEDQLRDTKNSKERLEIKYQLAEAYLKARKLDKAARNAQDAADLAKKARDKRMQAKVAYLDGFIHERRRDPKKAEARYKSALSFARDIKNNTIVANSLAKLAQIEEKERNYRQAYRYSKEATDFYKKTGGSSSASPSPSTSSTSNELDNRNKKLEADNRELVKENGKLKETVGRLKGEDNSASRANVDKMEAEVRRARRKLEAELRQQENALEELAEEKEKAEERTERYINRYKKLSKEEQEQAYQLEVKEKELLEQKLALQEQEQYAERQKQYVWLLAGAGGAALLVALMSFIALRINRRAKKSLEEKNKTIELERKRSDELLLNILPAPIAEELKENGKAKAQKFERVSVLFTDFKNFSGISEKLSPETLVAELDHCFKAFDYIISQYPSIEKIKTIGDAYMCASGLTDRRKLPNELVKAGLEMQEFLKEYKQERLRKGLPFFEARIGVHTGPVVAGVVGFNKFAYDIWGDTVNIASRMESNSEVGRVNISESTYNQVRYKFDCTPRGKIAAKNIGMIDMYYVEKEK